MKYPAPFAASGATATPSAATARAAAAAATAAAAAYGLLGRAVAGRPPGAFDRFCLGLVGHGLAPAALVSAAGLFPVYATLCAALLAAALLRRAWWRPVAISIVALLAAWRLSDTFKAVFARPRPERWFVHHETSFSYASGHATLALAFYGFWAYVLWTSALPARLRGAGVAALGLWIAALGWSRLALGAHYASDVGGGYLLGAAVLTLAIAADDALRRRERGADATKVGAIATGEVLVMPPGAR